MKKKLLYIAGILIFLWGIAHLFPTGEVVKDFGDKSSDNKLIITMEWIVEGIALIFLGLLTIIVTKTDSESKLAKNDRLNLKKGLAAFGEQFDFIGVDWFKFKFYDLGDEKQIEEYINNSC